LKKTILSVEGIKKRFINTQALSGVSFNLLEGEIHAIVGENGAGKSTLMNIISGIVRKDEGDIYIDGKIVEIRNTHEARKYKINFVHQEIALCEHVAVAENIFMPYINDSKRFLVNYKKLYKGATKIIKPLAEIKPNELVKNLSVSEKQIVEIARGICLKCKVLILDEPTSSLTEFEASKLFKLLNELKETKIGIIYITHRMDDVYSMCDRVTILRDGNNCGVYNVKDISKKDIVHKMVGRDIGDIYPRKAEKINNKRLLFEVKNFNSDKFSDINFKLFEKEVVCIAGLIGSGRTELAKAICGYDRLSKGDLYYKNNKLKIKNYKDSIRNGIVYLTEDRKDEGLFLNLSIAENIVSTYSNYIDNNFLINNSLNKNISSKYIDMLSIKCRGIKDTVNSLSGGNQQKILFSKLLALKPLIIFLDEPTRGIDVGAKSEIYRLIRELSKNNIGIVLITSELPEVIGMADRVIVMAEGRITGELGGNEISEKDIMSLASI